MRWKVETKTTDTSLASDDAYVSKTKRTTKITRTQYITVGDIVGSAKSVAGAVKNIVKSVPKYIQIFKGNNDQASANLAQTCLNIATPLSTIITGSEVYKKAMNVVNTLTPIMKLIARGTGVWCSPGNAADIANIILGTVKQILIALVTAAILALKEWIWNFEFKLRELTEESSRVITKNLKKSNAAIQAEVVASLNNSTLGASVTLKTLNSKSATGKTLKSAYDALNTIAGTPSTGAGAAASLANVISALNGNSTRADGKTPLFGNSWITITHLSNNTTLRELRGSTNGCGIQYSDLEDGKIVWKDSNKTTGSFNKFAKLVKDDGSVIYVAGSCPYIKSFNNASDTTWSISNEMYDKDYFTYKTSRDRIKGNSNWTRISKSTKDDNTLLNVRNKTATGCLTPGDKEDAEGIWYSTDLGITWSQAPYLTTEYIGGFFEFGAKGNGTDITYPNTLVAASYDYHGLYYSDNGTTWTASKVEDKDLDYGRFTNIYDLESSRFRVNVAPQSIEAPSITATVLVSSFTTGAAAAEVTIEASAESNNDAILTRRRPILDYIHEHYNTVNGDSTYLKKFDNSFWTTLFADIDSLNYTLKNAMNGDRLNE